VAQENILVVEDEEDLLELIVYNLIKEGYQVRGASSGEEALRAVQDSQPDLVLLDIMLPGINGFTVCRLLKSEVKTSAIPVIMLTAKGEEADVVAGLELGADDYITKPFSPRVLSARVRAVLRRDGRDDAVLPGPIPIQRGELTIDTVRHEVLVEGNPITLTSTEFRILLFLATHPGWVYTRDQIINAIHEEQVAVTDRTVDVQIVGLRKKLGKQEYIETVRGIGYRFRD